MISSVVRVDLFEHFAQCGAADATNRFGAQAQGVPIAGEEALGFEFALHLLHRLEVITRAATERTLKGLGVDLVKVAHRIGVTQLGVQSFQVGHLR